MTLVLFIDSLIMPDFFKKHNRYSVKF